MDERIVAFRVGVVVVATVLIAVILVLILGEQVPFAGAGRYDLYVKLKGATGVMEETPVRMFGKLIGRVEQVKLEDDGVLVTLGIDKSVRLVKGDKCQVSSTLLGDATVNIIAKGQDRKGQPALEPGAVIPGEAAADPLEMVSKMAETFGSLEGDLKGTLKSVGSAGEEISKLAKNVNELLDVNQTGEGQQRPLRSLAARTEESLKKFDRVMDSLNKIVGDEEVQKNLKKALEGLPELMTDARSALDDFNTTMNTASQRLDDLKPFTESLGTEGPQVVADLHSSVRKIDGLLTDIEGFTTALRNKQGSFGKFVNDPQLYDNLNQAACNIERLTVRLRPIVEDVRVFTDKIARDPSRLGVSGAIRRPSGIK